MADTPETTDTTTSTTEVPPAVTSAASPAPDLSTTDEGSILNPKQADAATGDAAVDAGSGDGSDGADDSADDSPLFGAPAEDAAYELTGLPDGVTIDTDALAAISPVARELNLSNEGLSKIAGVYAETVLPHVQNTLAQQINDDAAQLKKDWALDTRAIIGGGKNAAGEDVTADPVFQGKPL